ncbi:MAG: GNAT family N-acetyltransferase [Xanthobacteraceae bacterium]
MPRAVTNDHMEPLVTRRLHSPSSALDLALSGRRPATAPANAHSACTVARIEVFDDLNAAEGTWRALESGPALMSPYQRFDLLAAWQEHVGKPAGILPFIVTAFDAAGEPLFLWPFGRLRNGPLWIVRFLGSKHANFNLGLWRRDFLAKMTVGDLRHCLAAVAERGVDLAMLSSQPLSWAGAVNPFALLPHQRSTDASARRSVAQGDAASARISPSFRSRLRAKERKLQGLSGYRYLQARKPAEIDYLLETFFALKSQHMALRGLRDVFADPGIPEFLRHACHCNVAGGRPLIELHALEGGGEVLALFGATVDQYRFSCMFSTYTVGPHARHSPGLILLGHMLDDCIDRGVKSFDIGVGRAHYKSFFCREPEPLFDSFLPFTSRGRLASVAAAAGFAIKRTIKENSVLWSGVEAARQLRGRWFGALRQPPLRSGQRGGSLLRRARSP